MVQIIQEKRKPSAGARLGAGLERGMQFGSQILQQQQSAQKMQQENQQLQALTGMDFSGITDPKQRQEIVSSMLQGRNQQQLESLKGQNKQAEYLQELQRNDSILRDLESRRGLEPGSLNAYRSDPKAAEMVSRPAKEKAPVGGLGGLPPNPEETAAMRNIIQNNPEDSAEELELKMREAGIRPGTYHEILESRRTAEKSKRELPEKERAFHTGFSKEIEKNMEQMRDSIPKKEMALNFARDAVETGKLDFFSPDKLADITGSDLFRTAKGAQLITAGKENLLSNMGRVSARAQNIWFEQRLNSMFPKIGQSEEANLTVQEMLEGELALDKAYLDKFDQISDEDEKNFGYVRKDISKRVHQALKPLEKHILQRTSFRMKQIEEVEKGLSKLKTEVGKNVIKGTPLTMAMAKLYKDKFGDKALEVAEKNGYYIPTVEEFKSYQQRPQEFREGLGNE